MLQVELVSIRELLGMNFFIPSYQRGYRWDPQQVKDLLEDIWAFASKKKGDNEIYCIQPLVLKAREEDRFSRIKNEAKDLQEIERILKGSWEVIDGQQRLTTIYILLSCLKEKKNKYTIEYETRPESIKFLEKIDTSNKEEANKNIDFFYMYETWDTIDNWIKEKEEEKKEKFKETLLNRVKFIRYIADEKENSIKVFTRLNIGKIALTDSELIKALFLNRTNFKEKSHLHLQQQEIASEWDKIEYTLQNDEFWLFMHGTEYDKPTRIDYIFDLIREHDVLKLNDLLKDNHKSLEDIIGTDNHKTFRYFYEYFKHHESDINLLDTWSKVKNYFQTIREWFDDLELYHYVGYLIALDKVNISNLILKWQEYNKPSFAKYVKSKIKENLKACKDLEKEYESDGKPSKRTCNPLLLLHNIQTVINQNSQLTADQKYNLPVFYKFPFHLFKREKWDVEHIDSNTTNNLEDEKSQKEWLKDMAVEISNEKLKQEIKIFIQSYDITKFGELQVKVEKFSDSEKSERLNEEEKNKVWNFCLLDSSTNRSYGNAIFSAKRRTIIGKDRGKSISIIDNLNIEEKDGAIAFVPPVTKNVFQKYYNPGTNILRMWTKEDAKAYKKNIESTLKGFLQE